MKGTLLVFTIGTGLCLLLMASPQTAKAQNGGSVEGIVELAAKQTPVRVGGGRYGRPAQPSAASESTDDSVLVWLVGRTPSEASPAGRPVMLDQKDQQFSPVLLPVRQNGTVRIRNSDPVYHNVFSLSGTKKFDVGRRPQGKYLDVTFDKAGKVDVFCDIHSNMHAVIYVMPPEVVSWAKVKSGETFRLEGLPAGSYKLKVMALGYEEQTVTVQISGSGTTNLGTLTLNS